MVALAVQPQATTGWRRAEAGLIVAAGALQTLAWVHTDWWLLPVLTLMLLVWRLDQSAPRRAAWLGWLYGTAWLCASVWWLFISMHRYGGLPAPVAAAAVLALSAALALALALAAGLYARWRRGSLLDVALFTALWLLAELARGLIFTGFPWAAAGYSQVDSPLAAWAPWVGVYGMGAALALLALALLRCLRSSGRQWRLAAGTVGLMALVWWLSPAFTVPAGELRVLLLQTNVKQDEKFATERMPEALAWVARQMLTARADLVLVPETAIPLLPFQLKDLAPGYWEQLREHFAAPGPDGARAALVGVPLGDFDRGYTNSVVGLSAEPAYRYDKWHLVPFGEFIPTGFRWFTNWMNIPLGDFERGVLNPPSFVVAGQRVAPNICYEDLFGEELARRFIDPALAPTLLANISNMGWFGNTIAIPQHLNISRLRSLELQRPMLRATNTGATVVIDHRGQVTAQLAPHTQSVLQGVAQGRQGVTPFAWWASRGGLWPLLGLALMGLGLSVWVGRR